MAATDQATAGVDRQAAADLDIAAFDRLPRLTRFGQADVIDRQVLAGGEAVVHLETINVVKVHPRAAESIVNGGPHMRKHVGIAGIAIEFLAQAQSDRAVSPALYQPDRPQAGMIVEELIAHQDDPGTAIGHLTAVESANPTFDAGVD